MAARAAFLPPATDAGLRHAPRSVRPQRNRVRNGDGAPFLGTISGRPTMGVMTAQDETSRAAILTVDDDPGVSRAVARDLRRQYGGRYRIVRAESARDGLEALRQMKLRGDVVAVILADYRMPELNGIEFLEQAMDIYPGARRDRKSTRLNSSHVE